MRERWGCDGPAETPAYEILCPTCDGTREAVRTGLRGEKRGGPCSTCEPAQHIEGTAIGELGENGEGLYRVNRCPVSIATPDVTRAYEARQVFQASGVLPVEGAWLDQSAAFVAFCEQFDLEASRVRLIEREAAEKAAKRRKR